MKFCPECGSDLNGKKICDNCTYNTETHKREKVEEETTPVKVYIPKDTSPRFGLLDPQMNGPIQTPDMFCPECGTPLINKFTECPNCHYKKEKKNSE